MPPPLFLQPRGGRVPAAHLLQRQKASSPGAEATARSESTARVGDAPDKLLCARCGNVVTARDQRIEVNGSHRHTFANPHGIVYEIACYSTAVGCLACGSESSEFAWFAGYGWTVQACGACGLHLGWSFRSDKHVFCGLVHDRLVEGRDAAAPGS